MVINVKKICAICVTYCFCVRLDRASPPRAKQAEICDIRVICVTYSFCVRLDRASPPRAKQAESVLSVLSV